ncbi:MAG: hypothetical protein V4627_08550 [Pseudomonadota bacterium]
MQFTTPRKKSTLEEQLARVSMGFLCGSIAIVAAFLTFAFTMATQSVWVVLAIACLGVYLAQFYYLGSIGRFEPRRRLGIWQLSLLGHVLLFGVVLWVVGDLSVALVLLLPEAISFVLHLVGIHRASKALHAT